MEERTITNSFSIETTRINLKWDERCVGPGHYAKYFTYSIFDQNSKKVIAVSLTQLTEVEGVSKRMEKTRLIKVLNEVKQKNLTVDQLTADQHLQIKKYLREQEEGIDHEFDFWHLSKSIKTKLLKVSEKKACKELKVCM